MDGLRELDLGGERSFIGAWFLPDLSVCDGILAYFNQSRNQTEGQIGNKGEVNKAIKDSVDVVVTPAQFTDPPIARYLAALQIGRAHV